MSKPNRITAVKGMNDILPPESARWQWLERQVDHVMAAHAYRNMRTPILEHTELFVRGLGEVTDVVEKEMYSFDDRADKRGSASSLSLRPENTAGVVRAVTQHNLLHDGGKRLYYLGPMFRRERPQRGRYRQFHQVGAEALGFVGPEVDAELILLAVQLWQALGLTDWRLELNCLGEPDERREHRAALVAYLEQHEALLDADARRRLHSNPLRILDTKNPDMQELADGAPRLLDHLGEASRHHFEQVQGILRASGVPFDINPRLVRGLDYYNLTVFEFITDQLGAQGTICGGGRYDYLLEQVGGRPAPAVGWALGVERVLELLAQQEDAGAHELQPDAYAVIPDAAAVPAAMACLQGLRTLGVAVQMHTSGSEGFAGLRNQLRRADASGARHALIFGADELQAGEVGVKPLRNPDAEQWCAPLSQVASWADRLKSAP